MRTTRTLKALIFSIYSEADFIPTFQQTSSKGTKVCRKL